MIIYLGKRFHLLLYHLYDVHIFALAVEKYKKNCMCDLVNEKNYITLDW